VVEAQAGVIVRADVIDVAMKLENVSAVPSQVEAGKTVSFGCAVANLSGTYYLTIGNTSRFEVYRGTTLVETLRMLESPLDVPPGGSASLAKFWSTGTNPAGDYRVRAVIEAESAGYPLTAWAENTFTILAAADFYLYLDPSSGQAAPGGSLSSTVHVEAVGTFTGTVTLSLSGVPGGVTSSLSQASGVPPFSSLLSLSISATATPGTYPITVRGTGDTRIRENVYTLTVLPPENLPPENVPPENRPPPKATRMMLFLHPLLVEVVPGVPYSLRFGLYNPDNVGIENVLLSQEGIENATLLPSRLALPALAKGLFTLNFTLPPETPEGMRTVTVSAFAPYENLLVSCAFYLRVKPDRRPWVNRAVEVNRLENKTGVTLTLQNGDTPLFQVVIDEYIPPALTDNLAEIEFEAPPPSRVYPENRVVEWVLRSVRSGERRTLRYWVPRLPSPELDLPNWFLAGLTLPAAEPFGLTARAENFLPGESARVWVTVLNYTDDNLTVSVTLRLPDGFYFMGEGTKEVKLGPRENAEISFLCLAHKTVRPGTYRGRAAGTGAERTIETEFDLVVLAPPPFPWHLLLFPLLAGVAGALLFILLRRERKRGRRRIRI